MPKGKIATLLVMAALFAAVPADAQTLPQFAMPGGQVQIPQYRPIQPVQPVQPVQPNERWTGQQLGDFNYWSSSSGQRVTCQTIGTFTYCD